MEMINVFHKEMARLWPMDSSVVVQEAPAACTEGDEPDSDSEEEFHPFAASSLCYV